MWFFVFNRLTFRVIHDKISYSTLQNLMIDGDEMPKEVLEAVLAIVRTGKEAIVKQEHGKWVVIENGRRMIYKEK